MDIDQHGTSRDELSSLTLNHLTYLSPEEAEEIKDQFCKACLMPGSQVMWTGVPREWVQRWADQNDMQTLTSAMGPLMDPGHCACCKMQKSREEWSAYVRGASSLFASYVPKGDVVTVLTRPPPHRLRPDGFTTYQSIELPILMGQNGSASVSRIDMVHLTVADAENYRYQVWPIDQLKMWLERHGSSRVRRHWRIIPQTYVFHLFLAGLDEVSKGSASHPAVLKLKVKGPHVTICHFRHIAM
jgi:hypothetical protein